MAGALPKLDGFDLPLRLVIGEDGAFEGVEGDPVRARYRGTLALSDGRLAWKTRTEGPGRSPPRRRREAVLAGRVIVTPADRGQPYNFDVRLEARARTAARVAAGRRGASGPAPGAGPTAPSPAVRPPATGGPAIVVRFPLEQARLSDTFTVLVADVTSGQVLTPPWP